MHDNRPCSKTFLIIILSIIILFQYFPLIQNPAYYGNMNNATSENCDFSVAKQSIDHGFRSTHSTRSSGYFEDASTGLPTSRPGTANDAGWTGLTFGHINKDNNLDLVCVGRKGDGPEVFLGNGAGAWTKSNTGLTSGWSGRSDVRIVDINKDGNTDILSSDSDFWQGDGTGKWSSFPSPPFHGEDVDFGDFNNDTHLDVAIVGHLTGGVKAYFGYSNGTWVETNSLSGAGTGSGGHKIAVGDVNNDGYDDIISTYWYSSSAWLSDGTGNWTRKSTGIDQNTQFWGVDVGDINNDGNLDLVFGSYHSNSNPPKDGVRVYKGDGTGGWVESGTGIPTSGTYGPVRLADMDLDGNLDIVTAKNAAPGGVHLYLGDGNFVFTEVDNGLPKSTSDDQEGLGVGDIDGNGYPDVGIPYYGPTGVEVWRYIEPPPISLNLTYPDGGEKIRAGTKLNITWTCNGGVLPLLVRIDYSTTGIAGPYYPIESDLLNTGSYTWEVDEVVSDNCIIKIEALDSCKFQQVSTDYSNDSFEIFMIPLDRVTITPDPAIVHKDDDLILHAQAFDTNDDEILGGLEYNWTVSDNLGYFTTIPESNTATFTATNYGRGDITVKADYFIWSDTITISLFVPRIPERVTFSHDGNNLNFSKDQERAVKAFVYDSEGYNMTTLSGMKYVWSMSGSYGEFVSGENSNTVTIKGIELSYGELKLQVKYYGSSTSKTVEVNIYPKLGSILIQPQNIYTSRNTNTDLTLYLYDENNYQVSITPDVQITWKVIGGIGTIQPLHGGSMAIFASTFIGTGWVEAEVNYYGDVFTNRTRIIVPQTLDYIKAEPSTAIVYCDDEFQFSVSAFDTNDNLISGKIDYQWDLLYDLGEIIDTSEDNTKIFRPITPGETVIVVNADYYGSSATLQIRITVPPKLNKLSLKPGRAIIPLNNGQTFEVRAYDSDDIIVMDNITYSWAFANVTGNLQELDEQYKVKFIGQSLGFGQIIVEAIHYTKMLKLRTNITIVQRLSKILIDHANTEVFTGESYILTAIPYDDADEMIAGNVDFNWITSTGELVPFDDHNSSVEFLSKSTGNIKITVTGHYYGIDIEETIELQVKEKKTGGDRFGGVVLFVIIGVIGIIIIFLIIFMVLKRKHHPNLRKKTDTGIGMNGSTLDYRVPLTTTDVRTYPGPETTTLNAQPIQQVQYLQPIQSMVPNQYLQPIQPQPSELFPTLNEIQQSQIQPQSKQQETRDNDSSSQLLQYTPPKHSDQSHGSSSQE